MIFPKVLFVAGLKQDEASICLNQPHESLEMMSQRLTKQFALPTVQGRPVQIRIKPVAIEEDMETDNLFTDGKKYFSKRMFLCRSISERFQCTLD